MKTYLFNILMIISAMSVRGQGLIYDQQSAYESAPGSGENSVVLPTSGLSGQFFTPTLSSVGFVQCRLYDLNPGNSLGAILSISLWAGSLTAGTLLGSTDPVSVSDGFGFAEPDNFNGFVTFSFSTPVSVTPGTTYYFEVALQSGSDEVALLGNYYNYAGGTAFYNGQLSPFTGYDLWFGEGIYAVPEPSPAWLILFGGGVLIYFRRKNTARLAN
jgi:PEP-CTERM motif